MTNQNAGLIIYTGGPIASSSIAILTATPSTGSTFANWTLDGIEVSSNNEHPSAPEVSNVTPTTATLT